MPKVIQEALNDFNILKHIDKIQGKEKGRIHPKLCRNIQLIIILRYVLKVYLIIIVSQKAQNSL